MMKMLLNLNDQMYNKKTSRILLWLTSLKACKIKLMKKIFLKKKLDDCGIVPNEKKN